MKFKFLFFALLFCGTAHAATDFTATGQGEASAVPDQFSLTIDVQSRCYDKARDAVAANAAFADAISEILKKYASSAGETVVRKGTTNIRLDKMLGNYNHTTGTQAVLCEGYFTDDSLTLVTDAKNTSAYPEIVFAFYDLLDQQTKEVKNSTTGTLGSVTSLLKHETRNRINAEALEKATLNALENVRQMAVKCGVDLTKQAVELVSVTEGSTPRPAIYSDEGAVSKSSMPMASGGSAPEFGAHWAKKIVTIVAQPSGVGSALLNNCKPN